MLFPDIEPYQTHRLKVSDIHTLFVEEAGNPQGLPVVFLHGGPGGGISPRHRRLFDPSVYRIVLFDQRGAGQSTPHACLEENTTWHLVADLETLRQFLNIPAWLVFGGSWGSTLALAYAQAHPASITGLILRGIFLCRDQEIRWFYQSGCHQLFPERWEQFLAPIPPDERGDLLQAYHRRLTHAEESIRLEAARAWSGWEGATCKLIPHPETIADFETVQKALAMARIECHYFVNRCWFRTDDQLLADAHRIAHLPTWIVHGRYDVICPVRNAWELSRALPQAHLTIVPDAGHAFDEPGIQAALLNATQSFQQRHPQ